MAKSPKVGIYCIKNRLDGKVYVGSSSGLVKRRSAHIRHLTLDKHANKKLQRAWNKYGAECFEFIVLEEVSDVDSLVAREQHWIDALGAARNGYNIRAVAESNRGVVASQATRLRMSAALTGKKKSPEHCANIGLGHKGKLVSPETRAKISASSAGRTHSAETREKISKISSSMVRKPMTKEHCANISAGKLGIKYGPRSAEHRAKLSEASKRRGISAETQAKMQASRAARRLAQPV
jgi:group I intron endonuclease